MNARMALAFIFVFFTSIAHAEESPAEIPSPVDRIFVPHGFDDNDDVEIVMHGDFKDACHHIGRTGAEVDEEAKHITVWASAYVYAAGTACTQTVSPFLQTVRVGLLKPGRYTVSYRDDASIQAEFGVRVATAVTPDDHLYAPVENATVYDAQEGGQTLVLQGHYPYMYIGCMQIKEVRMTREGDVLVVQPITEILQGDVCRERPSDQSYAMTVAVPEPLETEGLLHVRGLNGDSLNRLVQP